MNVYPQNIKAFRSYYIQENEKRKPEANLDECNDQERLKLAVTHGWITDTEQSFPTLEATWTWL